MLSTLLAVIFPHCQQNSGALGYAFIVRMHRAIVP